MPENQQAVVIGGGAIGCCAAYYLVKQGWKVRLLEADRVGQGCSHGNCGFICPSHVLPLTKPGMVGSVLRQLLSKDAAIHIPPRFDPKLWSWLVQFAFHCRETAMMRASHARHALLSSSMALYRQLLQEAALQVDWYDRGLLVVYKSPERFTSYRSTAEIIRQEFGIAVNALEGSQLTDFEPALRPGPCGWHFPGDAHLRPDRLLCSLVMLLRSLGVEICEGVRVTDIEIAEGRAQSVTSTVGRLAADVVVVSAGAETPVFAQQLGCKIPIQPGKGYSVTMAPPERAPKVPVMLEEYHVAVTPWTSGLRIGSTMELAGYDRTINRRRIELFKRAVEEYFVEPPREVIQEEWWGWRPMTYDDLPCIGPAPRAGNVIVSAGHGMIGIATATATGKLVAELATGLHPHIDPVPYSLSRFS